MLVHCSGAVWQQQAAYNAVQAFLQVTSQPAYSIPEQVPAAVAHAVAVLSSQEQVDVLNVASKLRHACAQARKAAEDAILPTLAQAVPSLARAQPGRVQLVDTAVGGTPSTPQRCLCTSTADLTEEQSHSTQCVQAVFNIVNTSLPAAAQLCPQKRAGPSTPKHYTEVMPSRVHNVNWHEFYEGTGLTRGQAFRIYSASGEDGLYKVYKACVTDPAAVPRGGAPRAATRHGTGKAAAAHIEIALSTADSSPGVAT